MLRILTFAFLILSFAGFSQDHSHAMGRKLKFPDIPGYKTLKCDFHQHTVFSDGSVWPDIRVQEALMDGLDAISLTEHLEYQPHKDDIPHPDRNRSYEIAIKEAKNHDLLIVKGSEITRRMPPGHNNAIFLSDANKLLVDDSIQVFREAKMQGAFIFWNHPNWISQRQDGMATLTDVHRLLIREKLLDGIEVVNDQTYSDEALQIALDNNLTIMGTSDIHKLIDWDFKVAQGGHRPLTLVFAKERSEASIKDALISRRTLAVYKGLLIGRDEFLVPLIENSLKVSSAKYIGKSNVLGVEVENLSGTEIVLQNQTGYTLHSNNDLITLKAGEKTIVEVKTIERKPEISLKFLVLSAVNAPNKHPSVSLNVKIEEAN
ncbi:MAG TPA: Sb-PDE family phosphodiesterase [Chitinophagaceae bacterium]|nr:Sb-PDE family phosphodiesterase [Chitinophagaceae bacterium]